jgi:hypothetical protein
MRVSLSAYLGLLFFIYVPRIFYTVAIGSRALDFRICGIFDSFSHNGALSA